MVVVDRKYAGAAVATVLSGAITPSVPGAGQTFTVADSTGYPLTGKFPVVLSRGNSDEEKILVASRSGSVFTVSSRGYDGTTAQTHADQSSVELCLDAVAVNLFVDHVDDVETAPHAAKLPVGTTAGHDVSARHTFGAAFPNPATPAALTPDIAGSAGAAAGPARADHVHNVPAAVPVAIGTALAEGAGTSFARDNHVHVVGAGAINSTTMFAAQSVPASALVNDSLTASQIAPLAVGSSELGAAAVIAGKIAAGGVSTTAEITDGIVTLLKMASEASTDYTPTAASFSSAGGMTVGTGTTYGHYFKLGRIVVGWCGFAMGATGNLPSGNSIRIPLPVAARTVGADNMRFFVAARCRVSSSGAIFSGTGVIQGGNQYGENVATAGASAEWDETTPFNWGTSGVGACTLDALFAYETAA